MGRSQEWPEWSCPAPPSHRINRCFPACLALHSRVVVSYMGKNYFRNFLAPNPGICEVPGENLLGEIIFESDHIYPVLNDLEVSRNVI